MIVLAWASFAVGTIIAIVALIQLSRLRRMRHSQLIADLREAWDSKLLIDSRQRANKLADEGKLKQAIDEANKANSEEFFVLLRVPNFFDSVGAMVEPGDLPKKLAKELFDKSASHYWDLYGNALSAIDLEGVSHFKQLVETFQE